MKIFRSLEACKGKFGPTVATVGNFDGVHRAHRELLRWVVSAARETGGTSALVTFAPHPARILSPASAPPLLTTVDQKLELVAEQGLDVTVLIPFDRKFASLTPLRFVRDVLTGTLRIEKIFVGPNFFFGQGRKGDVHFLRGLSSGEGPEVVVLDPLLQDGELVNSSRIRTLLLRGEVEKVREMLGRPYFIDGTVIAGKKKGQEIGVPTANLSVKNEMIPPDGVYVTEALWKGRPYPGVTNIGERPTFDGAGHAVETHFLDFQQEIYGEAIRLRFLAHLREERRFSSPDALREQIDLDRAEARRFFDQRQ